MRILKRAGLVVCGGVLLHFCAMAALLVSGGMVMRGFEDGSDISLVADLGLAFTTVVWWPSLLIPNAPSGVASHLVGISNASAWVLLVLLVFGFWSRRRGRMDPESADR